MSQKDVISFFQKIRGDHALQGKFKLKSLEELLFHSQNMGCNFTREELAAVLGSIEMSIIQRMGEEVSGHSSLWSSMWGKYFFMWVIEDVINIFSEEELEEMKKETKENISG